jgi:glycine/D-amino acid oxidase-like deaminating enzyme
MGYTKGAWKERIVMGERQIYVENEDGIIEVVATNVRHWNADIIKSAPDMYEALSQLRNDSQWAKLRPNTREAIIKALAKAEE